MNQKYLCVMMNQGSKAEEREQEGGRKKVFPKTARSQEICLANQS